MAEFSLGEIKKSISKKANEVNIKTSTFLEINKLKSYISAVRQENTRNYGDIGQQLYSMWESGKIEMEKLEPCFREIKENQFKIQEYESQIRKIEEDNKKYLGAGTQVFCTECGAGNSVEALFCRECGKKLG